MGDTIPSSESRDNFRQSNTTIQRIGSASLYKRKIRAQRATTQDFDRIENATATAVKSPYQPGVITNAEKIIDELEKARKTINSQDSRRSKNSSVNRKAVFS